MDWQTQVQELCFLKYLWVVIAFDGTAETMITDHVDDGIGIEGGIRVLGFTIFVPSDKSVRCSGVNS